MYGGEKRALYGGLALSDRQFLVAAYLTGLTAPDEPPYITTQSQFHVEQGWGADVLYEDDFITAYALGTLPVALSDGRIWPRHHGRARTGDAPATRACPCEQGGGGGGNQNLLLGKSVDRRIQDTVKGISIPLVKIDVFADVI